MVDHRRWTRLGTFWDRTSRGAIDEWITSRSQQVIRSRPLVGRTQWRNIHTTFGQIPSGTTAIPTVSQHRWPTVIGSEADKERRVNFSLRFSIQYYQYIQICCTASFRTIAGLDFVDQIAKQRNLVNDSSVPGNIYVSRSFMLWVSSTLPCTGVLLAAKPNKQRHGMRAIIHASQDIS